jgi:hypothetical protein
MISRARLFAAAHTARRASALAQGNDWAADIIEINSMQIVSEKVCGILMRKK